MAPNYLNQISVIVMLYMSIKGIYKCIIKRVIDTEYFKDVIKKVIEFINTDYV